MTEKRSRTVPEIPLHLIARAVARQVRDWGDAVYRISVRRTHWHHYNVTVRTKSLRKELMTRGTDYPSDAVLPAGKETREWPS